MYDSTVRTIIVWGLATLNKFVDILIVYFVIIALYIRTAWTVFTFATHENRFKRKVWKTR